MNNSNKNNNNNIANDLAAMLAEVINELIKAIVIGLNFLIKTLIDFISRKIQDHKRGYGIISMKSLKSKKCSTDINFLGYSTNSHKFIPWFLVETSKHSIAFGASGYGKTVFFSHAQDHQLRINNAVIFFDPKADADSKSQFLNLCNKYSKPCYIISEDLNTSHSFNPFKDGSCTQIADRIMAAFDWSEQYFKDQCYLAINSILKHLIKVNREICLSNILEVYKEHFLKDDNLGLYVKLKSIADSDYGPLLNNPGGMTLREIREEGACAYLGLSTQAYPETARAVFKIFAGELLYNSYHALQKSKKEELKTYSIFFDEFGSVVTPNFIELLNKCRAAKMQLFMAVQSKADIDVISPQLTEQIIENCSTLIIFKQRLDSSASFFSKAIGTYKTKKFTQQRNEEGEKGGRSEREVYEHIVHPDVIKNLRVGQCVLLRHNPTRVDVVNIQKPSILEIEVTSTLNISSQAAGVTKKNIFEGE